MSEDKHTMPLAEFESKFGPTLAALTKVSIPSEAARLTTKLNKLTAALGNVMICLNCVHAEGKNACHVTRAQEIIREALLYT